MPIRVLLAILVALPTEWAQARAASTDAVTSAQGVSVLIRAREEPFIFSPLAQPLPTGRHAAQPADADGTPWRSKVEFYVDDRLVTVSHFDQPFGVHALQLALGLHLFRFNVALLADAGPEAGPAMDDDCVGQFEVDGPVELQPRLVFMLRNPGPHKFADALDCTLTRIPRDQNLGRAERLP